MEAEPRSDHLQCTEICDLNIIAHRTGRITDKLKIHNASLKCKTVPLPFKSAGDNQVKEFCCGFD